MIKMKNIRFLSLLIPVIAHGEILGRQERWPGVSDPLLMSRNFEVRLSHLPRKAKIEYGSRFWSGNHWPLNEGNINKRWYAKSSFNMGPPSRDVARTMPLSDLAQLSPAEKFDLFNGRYHYPLKKEVEKITNFSALNWEGICHGWAPAAMNHFEPRPKTLLNADGIAVPFGSTDIKALLSYYYAYVYQVPNTHQIGRRCFRSRTEEDENCRQDLNAGAFHIVLTNRIGLDSKGLIADMARYNEVWNHPIYAYDSTIVYQGRGPRTNSAPGTARTALIETTIYYPDHTEKHWHPVNGTALQRTQKTTLSYTLEIDVYGQIIGGEWQSLKRPDFLWVKERTPHIQGAFWKLADLLND